MCPHVDALYFIWIHGAAQSPLPNYNEYADMAAMADHLE